MYIEELLLASMCECSCQILPSPCQVRRQGCSSDALEVLITLAWLEEEHVGRGSCILLAGMLSGVSVEQFASALGPPRPKWGTDAGRDSAVEVNFWLS